MFYQAQSDFLQTDNRRAPLVYNLYMKTYMHLKIKNDK